MKRLENLITGLTGVLSARVVATPLGEVSEVHVLTKSDMAAKQVVRNIESALMAQLGFKIDHRKISVAQTADVRPIEALQEEAISERSKRRVVVFKHLEVRPADRPQRVQMRVTLAFGEKEAQAEELGPTRRAIASRRRRARRRRVSTRCCRTTRSRSRGADHRRLRSEVRVGRRPRTGRSRSAITHRNVRDSRVSGAQCRARGAGCDQSLGGRPPLNNCYQPLRRPGACSVFWNPVRHPLSSPLRVSPI